MNKYAEQLKQMTNEELLESFIDDQDDGDYDWKDTNMKLSKAELLSRMEPYRLARAGGHDIAEYYEEEEQPSQEHLKEALEKILHMSVPADIQVSKFAGKVKEMAKKALNQK